MPRLLFLCFLLLWGSCKLEPGYEAVKTAYGESGMVVSPHPLASQVGLEILQEGGNAVDAAIAIQFALAVVYPRAGNLGGGGFMVLRNADGSVASLDYREQAPAAATAEMYLDSLGNVIPDLSLKGHLAVGVPGTVDGMVKAHERYGKIKDWKRLVEPAIKLAQNGFRISETEADRLNLYAADFEQYSTQENPFLSRKVWRPGQWIIQPELATTLERIRDQGESGFYAGETARLIVEEIARGGGILTAEDLIAYNAQWREPLVGDFREYRVISMPPPSSGGLALLQLLGMVEHRISASSLNAPANSHLLVEAMRRVYADRAEFLGDMDYFPVPLDSLLDSVYLESRMADYNPNSATQSDSILAGNVPVKIESFETTHTSVVDPFGNAVAITTTLNSNYGCKVVVGGAGFFLNNEMDDFSIKPGIPNQFGLIGSEANKIEPGKRMLSSMTPTILEKDGEIFLVLGTPGGSTIITSIFQVILQTTVFDKDLEEAVAAPRLHHQWLPDEVWYERGKWDIQWLEDMQNMGHKLVEKESLGRIKAILRDSDGQLIGVGDPRQPDDDARGW
ncbi:MAG: gamma-glutamyltransferase [Saprospiraceae bacterium]|nr:gamma-glutamyltransferase [Saprospiraceae bacterium]